MNLRLRLRLQLRLLLPAGPAVALALGLLTLGSGCGSDGGSGTPATVDMAEAAPDLGSGYPAPFPKPPMLTNAGGRVLASPKIYGVFFANSNQTFKPQLVDFEKKLGSTEYWRATTEEYGVGPANFGGVIELKESPTGMITSAAVEQWLAARLNADDPAFPELDENNLFVIHYPSEVTITQPNFFGSGTSCVDFGGYHSNVELDRVHGQFAVAYAVIPDCGTFGDLMGLDSLTGTESHEIIEAATDPFPASEPAWSNVDNDHLYWSFALGGGENADLCAQDPASFTKFAELKYVVQRSWSNLAAQAGKDPCVPPLPKSVYFNAAAEMNEPISLPVGQGQSLDMVGVIIPVGQTKTIPVRLYSEADTGGDWKVSARDMTIFSGGVSTLSFTWDKTSGHNGDTLNLTIKSTKQSQFGASAFMLTSKLGTAQHFTFGLVAQ